LQKCAKVILKKKILLGKAKFLWAFSLSSPQEVILGIAYHALSIPSSVSCADSLSRLPARSLLNRLHWSLATPKGGSLKKDWGLKDHSPK